MKEKPREELYGNLSDAIKRKKAIEWCMKLLRLDIDSMSESEFYDFVTEYECIVAYPEELGFYYFTPGIFTGDNTTDIQDPSEQENIVRVAFKDYRKVARELISAFEKMRDKPRHWVILSTKMKFTVRANMKGIYSITDNIEHDFEYSYAWRIARFLRGNKLEDVIKTCLNCGNYFAVFSKHGKQCCSHNCSMLLYNKKQFAEDQPLAIKKRNISSYLSQLKKGGITDKQMQGFLRTYIRKKNYSPEEIPRYIEKFLKKKS